ncbi:MAG: hypothetical protein Q9175_007690, partial [Cornicularia normoerica]
LLIVRITSASNHLDVTEGILQSAHYVGIRGSPETGVCIHVERNPHGCDIDWSKAGSLSIWEVIGGPFRKFANLIVNMFEALEKAWQDVVRSHGVIRMMGAVMSSLTRNQMEDIDLVGK